MKLPCKVTYAHLNPMPYEAAAQMEKDLAEDLRRDGYTVTGGHQIVRVGRYPRPGPMKRKPVDQARAGAARCLRLWAMGRGCFVSRPLLALAGC